jgi:AFG3 family protein
MSQEPQNRMDKKLPRYGNRPGEDPNQPPRKPRFNIYWIYAIIFAVLIGFQLFGGAISGNSAKTTQLEFKQMITQGGVFQK